ncbi:MAG: hypothetical protein ACREBR_01410, partial [bacterium]
MVLHCILAELDAELRSRAETRRNNGDDGDDGSGGITDLFAFLDDTSSVVTYDVLLCLFQRFVELGAPSGCLLAQGKYKILTSTCGVSPRQFLHPNHRFNLDTALITFCGGPSGELLHGTRLLGYPLGNAAYVRSFLQEATSDFNAATTALNDCISDPQVRFTIFKACVQPKISHLELPDMGTTQHPNTPSPFTAATSNITHTFLTTLLHGQDTDRELSTVSLLQAIQPVAMGGLGLRSSCDSRVGRFLLSTIRSIRHTSDDVTLPTPTDEDHPPLTIELPATIRRLFHPWQSTSPQLVKVFQHFQDHLHQLPPFSDTKIPDLPNYITCQAPLTDLAKKLYRRLVSTRLKDHASTLPIEDQLALRSLQNHLATVPLAHTTRRLPANRLHPADFRTLVGLSICDTIFDGPIPTTRCLCNHADLDKRGHHLFSCSEVHKTTAHHIIRDALHRIFKEIA